MESQIREGDGDTQAIDVAIGSIVEHSNNKTRELRKEEFTLENGSVLVHFPDASGGELIGHLFRSNKDEAILLDFWGTWCAPCIADMPDVEKKRIELAEDPIEFVFLACYSESENAMEVLEENAVGGTHIIMSDSQTKELMSLFKKDSWPAYVMITSDRKLGRQDARGKSATELRAMINSAQ